MSTQEPLEYWPKSDLVSPKWVNEHLQDGNVRVVKVIYNLDNKESSTLVPGSTPLIWDNELDQSNDPQGAPSTVRNEKIYTRLPDKIGTKNKKTTIVLYSDLTIGLLQLFFGSLSTLDMKMESCSKGHRHDFEYKV